MRARPASQVKETTMFKVVIKSGRIKMRFKFDELPCKNMVVRRIAKAAEERPSIPKEEVLAMIKLIGVVESWPDAKSVRSLPRHWRPGLVSSVEISREVPQTAPNCSFNF